MRRRGKYGRIALIFIFIFLLIFLLFFGGIRRSAHIRLGVPEENDSAGATSENVRTEQVAVTPQTVQRVIATLRRPDAARRSVSVIYYWGDGVSGTVSASVYTLAGWTRVDTERNGAPLRHYVSDGKTCYVWYGTERNVAEYPASAADADEEQSIPTYEDVLEVPTEDISDAGYENYGEVPCLFAEVQADGEEGTLRYYVSVENGLLVAAVRFIGEQTVYEMTATEAETLPTAEDFVLPDGKRLIAE